MSRTTGRPTLVTHVDGKWEAQAACVGHAALFAEAAEAEPGGSQRGTRKQLASIINACRAICVTCPVKAPCLDAALTRREPCGIWGGYTTVERRGLPQPKRRPAECGTESGYSRHRRLGEETCAECRKAWADAESARNARRSNSPDALRSRRARNARREAAAATRDQVAEQRAKRVG